MNSARIGTWTLGFGLIGLGAVAALAVIGVLSWSALAYVWPALLVALGIELVVARRREPGGSLRLHGGAVALTIVALVLGFGGGVFGFNRLADLSGEQPVPGEIRRVVIDIPDGAVSITGAESDTLAYEGALPVDAWRDDAAQAALERLWSVEREGDALVLRMKRIGIGPLWSFWGDAHLDVRVPARLAAAVETRNGAIEVRDLDGDVDAHTSNGRIEFTNLRGSASGESSNGACTATGIGGDLRCTTSNGALTVRDAAAAVQLRTSNGSVKATSAVGGDWRIETSNGRIDVQLPVDAAATISAQTSSAGIGGDVAWRFSGRGDRMGTAVLGAGTHRIDLRTSNGRITVETTAGAGKPATQEADM